MASSKQKPKAAGPATKGLKIVARSEQGMRRAGRYFGPTETVVPLSELTEEDVAAIKGERHLVVVECDIEAEAEA